MGNMNDDIIRRDIEDLKEMVSELTGTADDYDLLKDLMDLCKSISCRMARGQCGYFVSVNDIGPDDDFIRCYTPLWFMPREEAEAICKELGDDSNCSNDGVMAVDEYTYELYMKWLHWNDIKHASFSFRNDDVNFKEIYRNAEKQVDTVKAALGRTQRWEQVGHYRKLG